MKVTRHFPYTGRSQCDRATLLLVCFALLAILWPQGATGQQATAPKLKLAEIEQLVAHNVPDATLGVRIQKFGLDFAPSPAIVESLRAKGAGPETLAAINALIIVQRSKVLLPKGIERQPGEIMAQFRVHLFKQDGWYDPGIPITDDLYLKTFRSNSCALPDGGKAAQIMVGKTIVYPSTDPKAQFYHLRSMDGGDGRWFRGYSQEVIIPEKSIFHPLKVRILPESDAPEECEFYIIVIVRPPGTQGEFSAVQLSEEQALVKEAATLPAPEVQLPAQEAHTSAPTTHLPAQAVHTTDEVWIDPATGLMWTKRDNGGDANWQQAMDYCQNLQLAGYSDWRLPTIDELQGIYDTNINISDQCCGQHQIAVTWHVKGNFQLSGWYWSSSQNSASGRASFFNFFGNGMQGSFKLAVSNNGRALCVRRSGMAVDRAVPTEPPPPPRAPVPAKRAASSKPPSS